MPNYIWSSAPPASDLAFETLKRKDRVQATPPVLVEEKPSNAPPVTDLTTIFQASNNRSNKIKTIPESSDNPSQLYVKSSSEVKLLLARCHSYQLFHSRLLESFHSKRARGACTYTETGQGVGSSSRTSDVFSGLDGAPARCQSFGASRSSG